MYETPSFSQAFQYALQNIIVKLVQYVPLLISAILILVIGWIIAGLVARALNKLLRVLAVDKLFEQAKVDDLLKKAGSRRDTVSLISHIVKWILLLVVFMSTVQTLRIAAVTEFFDKVIAYTPNVIAAVVILLLGAILANFIDKVIEGFLKASKLGYSQTLSEIAKYAIYIFTIISALNQLGIAKEFMQIFFTGLVVMFSLAGGLAFGLGSQQSAKEFVEKIQKETSKKE